jgi:NAD(P)-dependent dehydrogenase (short-subunit alcohol dehydrogenase family)
MLDNAKTIVITGASSGIGKATARLFAKQGWNVVAGMRQPQAERELVEGHSLKLVSLDVQNPQSVHAAVTAAISAFGGVDVWLNNAGYGARGPVEAASRAQIQRQFAVNVFGLIECIQAIAPHFRLKRAGVLVNVSSAGGLAASPGFAVYNASKFAVEGLSEGLWYELGAFGVRVKLIEPGVTKTDFGGRSLDAWDHSNVPDYKSVMQKMGSAFERFTRNPNPPEIVAATIFKAATDPSDRLRYLVGADAKLLWRLRRWVGYRTQMRILRRLVGL